MSAMAAETAATDAIRVRGVGKRFPGVIANHDVDIDIRTGTVHALIGENGAGKSTLMKVLSGVYAPDTGTIEIGGAPAGEVDDLVSMIQISMQREAQRAVDCSGLPASIVAIQPSTGGVLAVAQNSAADRQGPVSLQGRFPPGSIS